MPHKVSLGTPRHSKQNKGFVSIDLDTTLVKTGRLSLDKVPSKIPGHRSPRNTLPKVRNIKFYSQSPCFLASLRACDGWVS